MMRIAIIPARGGSKRIPKKKYQRSFMGNLFLLIRLKPLLQANCFERVIVSTDDEEIAKILRFAYGAEVPFIRPAKIADDHDDDDCRIATCDSIIYSAKVVAPTHVCCVYATAPFISSVNLERAFFLLKQKKCNYVYSVTNFSFPIQRAIRINEKGKSSMLMTSKHSNTRSQDLEELAYHDAGQFYWGLNRGVYAS